MSVAEMVAEFHRAIGAPVLTTPTIPSSARRALRSRLQLEEDMELEVELLNAIEGSGDLAKIAKEMCDVLCVTYGAAAEFGIPLDAVYAEVHRSNMAKVGGPRRGDGKQLKPEGWQQPDVARVLREAAQAFDRLRERDVPIAGRIPNPAFDRMAWMHANAGADFPAEAWLPEGSTGIEHASS